MASKILLTDIKQIVGLDRHPATLSCKPRHTLLLTTLQLIRTTSRRYSTQSLRVQIRNSHIANMASTTSRDDDHTASRKDLEKKVEYASVEDKSKRCMQTAPDDVRSLHRLNVSAPPGELFACSKKTAVKGPESLAVGGFQANGKTKEGKPTGDLVDVHMVLKKTASKKDEEDSYYITQFFDDDKVQYHPKDILGPMGFDYLSSKLYHGYMAEMMFHLHEDHDNDNVLESIEETEQPLKDQKSSGSKRPSSPAEEAWLPEFRHEVSQDDGSRFPDKSIADADKELYDIWESFDAAPFHNLETAPACVFTVLRRSWRDVHGMRESSSMPLKEDLIGFVSGFHATKAERVTKTLEYRKWLACLWAGVPTGSAEVRFWDQPLKAWLMKEDKKIDRDELNTYDRWLTDSVLGPRENVKAKPSTTKAQEILGKRKRDDDKAESLDNETRGTLQQAPPTTESKLETWKAAVLKLKKANPNALRIRSNCK